MKSVDNAVNGLLEGKSVTLGDTVLELGTDGMYVTQGSNTVVLSDYEMAFLENVILAVLVKERQKELDTVFRRLGSVVAVDNEYAWGEGK